VVVLKNRRNLPSGNGKTPLAGDRVTNRGALKAGSGVAARVAVERINAETTSRSAGEKEA
jgi:hypothetical protein